MTQAPKSFKPFDASAFRENLGGRPAQSNLFTVQLDLPPIFNEASKIARVDDNSGISWVDIFSQIPFRCEMTEMPGRILQTTRRDHHGPSKEIPTGILYNTTVINLIESKGFEIRALFDIWQEYVFSSKNNNLYTIPYYDDYVAATATITVYDSAGNPRRAYKLINAFPVSVSPNQLGWGQNDDFVSVPIELSYQKWEAVPIPASASNIDRKDLLSDGIQKLQKTKADVLLAAFKNKPTGSGLTASQQLKDGIGGAIISQYASSQDVQAQIQADSFLGKLSSKIIPTIRDVVANRGNIPDIKRQKGLDVIAGIDGIAGSVLTSAGQFAKENLPPALGEDLVPAAQAVLRNISSSKIDKLKKFL